MASEENVTRHGPFLHSFPSSILDSYISFLISLGIDHDSYLNCFPFLKGILSPSSPSPLPSPSPSLFPLNTLPSPSPVQWSEISKTSITFLGYIRSALLSLSPLQLSEILRIQCSLPKSFDLLLRNEREYSVQLWIKLSLFAMSERTKDKIFVGIERYCREMIPCFGERKRGRGGKREGRQKFYWDERVLERVRGVLFLLRLMVPSCCVQVLFLLNEFMFAEENFSYTTHQWVAEVFFSLFLSFFFLLSLFLILFF